MLKFNRLIIASVLIFSQISLLAQNNTNSPYTRYGYGELADRSFGAGRAMGGVGIGLRSSKQINPMNPASYSSIDSMTFIFDFGIAGQLSWFNDGINSQRNINGNVEYVALQFPITKWLAFSAGILPYSYVGYNYGEYDYRDDGTIKSKDDFTGTGGLNDLYGGVSIEVWKKRLSIGANIGYLFGNINHTEVFTVNESNSVNEQREKKVDVRDVKMDFGLQYTHPISKTENITLGAVFSPAKKLNTEKYVTTIQYESTTTGLAIDTINGKTYEIPNSFGVGLSYTKTDKMILAADFLYEDWANASFESRNDQFKNRIRVAAGGEYIPDHFNRSFFKRVRYRAGFHYSNSYLKIDDKSYNEYGASVGFGLPLLDNRSLINISLEYVKIKPDARPLIDEQYFRFTVNYTFNENWFFKFKVN